VSKKSQRKSRQAKPRPSSPQDRDFPDNAPSAVLGHQLVAQVTQETYQGPIPPPSLLQEYDAVVPGSAERILAMAERQSAHRDKILSARSSTETRDVLGPDCGLVLPWGPESFPLART